MKRQFTLAADAFRFLVAAVFVAMTMAFLVLPYALSAQPGHPVPPVAVGAPRHLT
ncbi:MAG: hypothetical protein PHY45_01335 [Rhodocyclaceae bacterium]|nr:hypothetical protein [Rhodocyclaceae bacterium]